MKSMGLKRKYLTIDEVQQEYLPISKKKIRSLAKQHLNVRLIGGRMYIERIELERLLASTIQS